MTPMIRTALTHAGTALGACVATAMLLATRSADILALYDQLNVVVAEITKLVALATPLATAAYAVWRATTKNKLQDLEQDARVQGVVISDQRMADELGKKVQTSVEELPAAAKAASSSRAVFVG